MKLVTAIVLFVLGATLVVATAAPATSSPVVVPYYGATYGPPAGFTTADAKRVVELLESIDRRLEAIEAKGGPVALKKGPDLFAVAKAKCASCHTPAKAPTKGGDFVLFNDDTATTLKVLNGREKTRVKESVLSGTMPPNAKLSADEQSAFKW